MRISLEEQRHGEGIMNVISNYATDEQNAPLDD